MAELFLRNFATGLRADDGLHLAIAKNNGANHLYSLDQGSANAAVLLDLSADSGH